ncbi:uncharacterized protein G2W53_002645 [Senna tora]|uniref:Uncharacterized protein n=1 Tax=Senna tora TaxID=362788 RepID=A0A835CIG4_9FABA|nr:uncharacterized protein G2W53_002645 [Senna tora]
MAGGYTEEFELCEMKTKIREIANRSS